jgi:hypothetical protein
LPGAVLVLHEHELMTVETTENVDNCCVNLLQ